MAAGGGAMSLRQAINRKCRDCISDRKCGGGTWREQVAQCSAIDCPLWPVRPAPMQGRFANPCRDPGVVPREWGRLPVGEAVSPHPVGYRPGPLPRVSPKGSPL